MLVLECTSEFHYLAMAEMLRELRFKEGRAYLKSIPRSEIDPITEGLLDLRVKFESIPGESLDLAMALRKLDPLRSSDDLRRRYDAKEISLELMDATQDRLDLEYASARVMAIRKRIDEAAAKPGPRGDSYSESPAGMRRDLDVAQEAIAYLQVEVAGLRRDLNDMRREKVFREMEQGLRESQKRLYLSGK